MLKDKLFWEKYRPTSLVKGNGKIPIILLPRIEKIINNDDIQLNMMFVGSAGLGKSSLALILTENTDVIKINCSIDTGIDVIRTKVMDHCKNFSIPFKNRKNKGNINGQKVVYLEEFDKTTTALRAGLRGFIEDFSDVRFIASVNNINIINRSEEDKALLSRFTQINFNPENKDEVSYLKTNYLKYLKAIAKNNKIEIPEEVLNIIINKSFPNLRTPVQILQEIFISGDHEKYLSKKSLINVDIYSYMLDGKNILTENFYFVMDNYPKEKTEELLSILSNTFIKYLFENYEDVMIKSGLKILDLVTKFNATYTITTDPETHLVTYITKIKELL